MTAIDIKDWKEFELGFLFNIVKGSRLTKAEMKEGETRFIGSSSMNNGCTALVGNQKGVHEGNAITVCYNGSVGETFYQDQPFLASDDVNILYPKFKMSKNIALFLAPIIKKTSGKYGFNYKWKKEIMIKEKIPLPVDSQGEPDWEYMENYMSKVLEESETSLRSLRQAYKDKRKIDTTKWKSFKVSEIFDCQTTTALTVAEAEKEGNVPYITRSAINNGCSSHVKNVISKINKGNCITIGAEGKFAFYQEKEFLAGIKIYTLRLKNRILTKKIALFLCTILNEKAYRYSYNEARILKAIEGEEIYLPSNIKGEPDWSYMEKYIKEITAISSATLASITTV